MKSTFSIKSLLSRILTKVLPDRTKRLVLLSSLYARMSGQTSFDSKTISKLNQIMMLSSKDSALEFPMQLSRVIWQRDRGTSVLYPLETQENEEQLVEQIFDKVPQCLLYSDKQAVSQDIAKLLSQRENLAI